MTIAYQFAAQLAQGETYEEQIDAFFRAKGAQISKVDRTTQRRGIDRVWYDPTDDRTWTVEYKADSLAGQTGNAFVEIISVDTEKRPGWAYSSQASLLIYLVTDPQTIYVISMARLRRCLPPLERRLPHPPGRQRRLQHPRPARPPPRVRAHRRRRLLRSNMATAQDIMLDRLDAANITAQQWRTARRLLDRTHPENGYARVTYDDMERIVESTSQATVRGHLAALAAAGLITYKRNSAIHIYWHIDAPAASPARAESSVVRAESSAPRAPEPPAEPEPEPAASPARAESSVVRANCSVPRAESSVVRAASLKATTTSRQAGIDPASQPAGEAGGKPQPQPPKTPSEPLSETQQRSLAMLTDPAIGLDQPAALRIARKHAHGIVLVQCCRYLRDVAAGKVDGPGVIGYRLSRAYGGSILPQDHRTAFWERHGERPQWPQPQWPEPQDDPADPTPSTPSISSTPPPPPNTPAAWWSQLQADFALHQPAGSVDSILQNSWVIAYEDGRFTIGIADAAHLDWMEKKLRNQVRRRLAVIMSQPTVDVTFQVAPKPVAITSLT
jgi:DNA-binding transcriptional ArsR family regulator